MLYLIFIVVVAFWIYKKLSAVGEMFSTEESSKNNKYGDMEEFKNLTKEIMGDLWKVKYYLRPVLDDRMCSVRVWITEQYASLQMTISVNENAVKSALGSHITNFDKNKVLEYLLTREGVNKQEIQQIFERIGVGYSGCIMIFPNYDYPNAYDVQSAKKWIEEYFRRQGYRVENMEDGIKVTM